MGVRGALAWDHPPLFLARPRTRRGILGKAFPPWASVKRVTCNALQGLLMMFLVFRASAPPTPSLAPGISTGGKAIGLLGPGVRAGRRVLAGGSPWPRRAGGRSAQHFPGAADLRVRAGRSLGAQSRIASLNVCSRPLGLLLKRRRSRGQPVSLHS